MAKARRTHTAMVLGVVRRDRRSLLMGTALQASVMLVLALPAGAQPAPNARPTGGVVAAGSAVISSTTSNTRIDQASQRAAIDWMSFDVGSQQRVTFSQPSASAVALNRVTGPDPSQIAGRIDANGQIILVNQSGVNFYKGAQVNAAGVMVSAANISNTNFMAGTMKFDQPGSPNAKIDNQGTITIKQAGLAALVAPQVANSGTISAKLGHVVLAGAKTATLDLFGDGLLSLDVTNQVMQAPVGKDGKAATALVTNTGVIVADGGTVQLTARAADGIVQKLVQAGGNISAATVGAQTGVVALNGVGGSVVVEGQLAAPGSAPGTKGGAIEVATTGNVVVAPTARINASGNAGGGVVALGTTLARAKGGASVKATVTAANTTIAPGANVHADAIVNGDGGKVAVLSAGATNMNGLIAAKGGSAGGAGGFVEVSGNQLGMTTGKIDVSAPAGRSGTILLDPLDLDIVAGPSEDDDQVTSTGLPVGNPDQNMSSILVSASALTGLTGNLLIEASRNLTVDAGLSFTHQTAGNSVTLLAGNTLTVSQPVNTAGGSLTLSAAVATDGTTAFTNFNPAGKLTVNAAVTTTGGPITLTAGTGGVQIAANVDAGNGSVQITSKGDIAQIGPTSIPAALTFTSDELHIRGNNVNLRADGNITQTGYVAILGDSQATLVAGGNITQSGATSPLGPFTDSSGALLGSVIFGGGAVNVTASHMITQSGDSRISSTVDGSVDGTANVTTTTGDLVQSGNAQIFADVTTARVGGNISQSGHARITADDADTDDTVSITAKGNISQTENASISAGTAGTLTLTVGGTISQSGGVITTDTLTGSVGAGALVSSQNQINNLGPFTAGAFVLVDSVPLTINGAVTALAMAISATGSISLFSDITTGGLPSFTTTIPTNITPDLQATAGGAFFNVLPDASGKSSFTASTHVSSLNGTPTFLLVSMPPQGGIVGLTKLNAPGTELFLNLGSGNAAGQIDVGSLVVIGAGGQVNFTNSTVQGLTGSAAALAALSFPPANPAYLLDGCEIGVGCGGSQPPPPPQRPPQLPPPLPPVVQLPSILQGVSVSSGISNIVSSLVEDASTALVQSVQETNPRGVPILNPMRDLSGGPLRDRQTDPDLLLPNVSEKDY